MLNKNSELHTSFLWFALSKSSIKISPFCLVTFIVGLFTLICAFVLVYLAKLWKYYPFLLNEQYFLLIPMWTFSKFIYLCLYWFSILAVCLPVYLSIYLFIYLWSSIIFLFICSYFLRSSSIIFHFRYLFLLISA